MLGRVCEVFICREQRQIVPDGELREHCVDGADLNSSLTACSPQSGRTDVVVSIWLEQRQGGEPLNDLSPCFGSRESLQKLLKHQSGSNHHVCSEQGVFELLDLRFSGLDIAAESQRPNACIDEKHHLPRDRSAL